MHRYIHVGAISMLATLASFARAVDGPTLSHQVAGDSLRIQVAVPAAVSAHTMRLTHVPAAFDGTAAPAPLTCPVVNGQVDLPWYRVPFGDNTLELLDAAGTPVASTDLSKTGSADGAVYLRSGWQLPTVVIATGRDACDVTVRAVGALGLRRVWADMATTSVVVECIGQTEVQHTLSNLPVARGENPLACFVEDIKGQRSNIYASIFAGGSAQVQIVDCVLTTAPARVVLRANVAGQFALWGTTRVVPVTAYAADTLATVTLTAEQLAALGTEPTVRFDHGYGVTSVALTPAAPVTTPATTTPATATPATASGSAAKLAQADRVSRCVVHAYTSDPDGGRLYVALSVTSNVFPAADAATGAFAAAEISSWGTWHVVNAQAATGKALFSYEPAPATTPMIGLFSWEWNPLTQQCEGVVRMTTRALPQSFIRNLRTGSNDLVVKIVWGATTWEQHVPLQWRQMRAGVWRGDLAPALPAAQPK